MQIGIIDQHVAEQVKEVFVNAIMAIDSAFYSEQQKRAWITGADNADQWRQYLQRNVVMGAWQENQLLGFVSYQAYRCYVDMLFVEPNWQGQGVATQLWFGALNHHYPLLNNKPNTMSNSLPTIFTHASAAARPFFTTHGFITLAQRQVCRNSYQLTQYWMMRPATKKA